VTECTGHYSQTAARKAGFQERSATRLAGRGETAKPRSEYSLSTHAVRYATACPWMEMGRRVICSPSNTLMKAWLHDRWRI
jgi:hypothetical protein